MTGSRGIPRRIMLLAVCLLMASALLQLHLASYRVLPSVEYVSERSFSLLAIDGRTWLFIPADTAAIGHASFRGRFILAWPLESMTPRKWWLSITTRQRPRFNGTAISVPLLPAAMCVALIPFVLFAFRSIRFRHRARTGRCTDCGYSLFGLLEGQLCPECGNSPGPRRRTELLLVLLMTLLAAVLQVPARSLVSKWQDHHRDLMRNRRPQLPAPSIRDGIAASIVLLPWNGDPPRFSSSAATSSTPSIATAIPPVQTGTATTTAARRRVAASRSRSR